MRRLVACFVLWPALAGAGPTPAPCPWKEPAAPPKLEIADGAARFSWPLDAQWFDCARRRGATLEVAFVRRDPNGGTARAKALGRTRADAVETLPLRALCDAAPTAELRVRVVGTGAMDRLLHETAFVPVPCFACAYSPAQTTLGLRGRDPRSPAGFVTAKGRFDAAWRECAARSGGTLSLGVYVGRSELEARTRRDASFAVRGLERDAAFARAFAPTELCAEARWVAVGFLGTGEFRQLDSTPRPTLELGCAGGP